MFDGLDHCSKIQHNILKNLHGALIIDKGLWKCGLYILYSYIIIDCTFIVGQNTHIKTKLWHLRLWYVNEIGIFQLTKQDLLEY